MRLPTCGVIALLLAVLLPGTAQAQISVLTVDCTPFLSPGPSAGFGPQNTMGMALTSPSVDPGGLLFTVTEDTPAAFRARPAAGPGPPLGLANFDLIAINNHPARLSDGCPFGGGGGGPFAGLGTTWPGVIGVASGGRVVLTSHDAPPGGAAFGLGFPPCPLCEPFGAPDLIRDAALWAGGGTTTGLADLQRRSAVQRRGRLEQSRAQPAARLGDNRSARGRFHGRWLYRHSSGVHRSRSTSR